MIRKIAKGWLVILVLSTVLTACGTLGDLAGSERVVIDHVQLVSMGANPPRHFAIATGLLPDGCSSVGRSTQRVSGNTVKVTLYVKSPSGSCSFPFTSPFKEKIQLDIREFGPGIYNVAVNGVIAHEQMTIGR